VPSLAAAALLALLARPCLAADIELDASVDRQTVQVGDTLRLTVEIVGTKDAGPPQIPKLDGLRIVGQSHGTSQQITMGGTGGFSSVVTELYQYDVEALKEGKRTIPRIEVHAQGQKRQTEPIEITVVPAAGPRPSPAPPSRPGQGMDPFEALERPFGRDLSDAFMDCDAEADKATAYVNEQITYTRTVVRSYDPLDAALTAASLDGFHAEDLPQPRPRRAQQNGRGVVVEEWPVALFASASGERVIEGGSLVYRATFARPQQTMDFPPVKVKILPLPAAGRPEGFEGAVGQWELTADLDTHAVAVGDAVTLRVRVAGVGNVQSLPLPQVTLPSEVERYDPTERREIVPGSDPVRGTLRAEYVLVPRRSGSFRVGPVRLAYFDPERKQYEVTEAAGGVLSVAAPAGGTAPEAAPRGTVEVAGHDIHHVKSRVGRGLLAGSRLAMGPAALVLQLVPLLVVGAVAAMRWRRQRLEGNPALARRVEGRRRAHGLLRQARQATRDGEAVEEPLASAVAGYVRDSLDLAQADLSGREAEAALTSAGCDEDLARRVRELLDECERRRFAPSTRGPCGTDSPAVSARPTVRDGLLAEAQAVLRGLDRADLTPGGRPS
jgi:hypothetical protein